jgi:peroxiredoxin
MRRQSRGWRLLLLAAAVLIGRPARAKVLTGSPAPAFKLKQLDGGPVSLAQYQGKVVLLDFWGPNCAACNVQIPHLQQLYQTYSGKGLRLLGIAELDPEVREIRAFLAQYKTTYPILLDRGAKVGKRFQVTEHPTTVLIGRDGVVRQVHVGFVKGDEQKLESAVQAALQGEKIARNLSRSSCTDVF